MPWGLKNKMIIKHTTTITEVKIDHTKRQLLTHKPPPPPEPAEPYTKLPHLHAKKVLAIEKFLYGRRHQDKSTAKEKQI